MWIYFMLLLLFSSIQSPHLLSKNALVQFHFGRMPKIFSFSRIFLRSTRTCTQQTWMCGEEWMKLDNFHVVKRLILRFRCLHARILLFRCLHTVVLRFKFLHEKFKIATQNCYLFSLIDNNHLLLFVFDCFIGFLTILIVCFLFWHWWNKKKKIGNEEILSNQLRYGR